MATSGTITYNETRDQLISDALSLLAILAAGETAQPADITFCSNALNKMVKAWMGQGIHLWTEEVGTIFLVQNQPQYNLIAGASGAKASDGTGTPVETTVAAAVGNGSTSVNVTNSVGMSNGDNIGICQDNQTIYWTTISSISGNIVNLVGTTTDTAAIGNAVYTYTTQMPRVLSIQSSRLRNNQGFDKMMEIKPREDYNRIPEKFLSGDPIILTYSPQLNTGIVYIWPAPSDVNKRLEITYLRTIQDFDNSTDNPDLPQEWLEAITYNLAVRIAPAYGINLSSGGIQGNPDIILQAASYLDAMKAWDTEQPYIQIVPKTRY